MLSHVTRHPKGQPAWLAEAKRLGLTGSGLHQLARGVAGKRIGGGQARIKLIADGYAVRVGDSIETVPTEKGRAAIERLRALGW